MLNIYRSHLAIRPAGVIYKLGASLSVNGLSLRYHLRTSATATLTVPEPEMNADKNQNGPIPSSNITTILRKAISRRTDAAAQFVSASRPELAESEQREADFLATFLPPSVSEADVDALLQKLMAEKNYFAASGSDPKRAAAMLMKTFFTQIDKSRVDGKLVMQRVQAALQAAGQK
ncbi:hypothetical protein EW145_g3167 [Phellinidium pouzarii]|uniref:Altered inheritance of mitochondria protein 41 n=1 Tax=Phellinidium pouzarii TaxID=167371 RepID=A0A4S4L833_9AGAM|nr:hypothetical protein EW145_g3167 [Phellinidium pouzarii]